MSSWFPPVAVRRLRARKIRFSLFAEGGDAFLVVLGFTQLLVGMTFDLEAGTQAGVVGSVEHPLGGLERERRHSAERADHLVENFVERRAVIGHARD